MAQLMARMLNFEASRRGREAEEILAGLGMRKGDAVADIGAGGGFFTFRFSREVGEAGTVFAVDTNPGYLKFIGKQAAKKDLGNVRTVAAGQGALTLPAEGLDLMFMRNVFHHLADPAGYLGELKGFLKPGGKLAIIDHSPGARGGFVRAFRHYTPEEKIIQAAEKAGFRLVKRHDFLNEESFLVFEPSPG